MSMNIHPPSCLIFTYQGFDQDVDKFLFYMLTLSLLSSTAAAMAVAISVRASTGAIANLGTAIANGLQIVSIYMYMCVYIKTHGSESCTMSRAAK